MTIKRAKIVFEASKRGMQHGFFLAKIRDQAAFTNKSESKFRRAVNGRFRRSQKDYGNYKVSILDNDTIQRVLMVELIPVEYFWQDVRELIGLFRTVFFTDCMGCDGAWRNFPVGRCYDCKFDKSMDVASEFNKMMEETFGMN